MRTLGSSGCPCLRWIPFSLPGGQQHGAGAMQRPAGKSVPARAPELPGAPCLQPWGSRLPDPSDLGEIQGLKCTARWTLSPIPDQGRWDPCSGPRWRGGACGGDESLPTPIYPVHPVCPNSPQTVTSGLPLGRDRHRLEPMSLRPGPPSPGLTAARGSGPRAHAGLSRARGWGRTSTYQKLLAGGFRTGVPPSVCLP